MNSDHVVHAVVMCLSLHPSVTSRYCITMAECMITQTMLHDSPGTRNFLMPRTVLKLELSPLVGVPNAGRVGENWQLSTNNTLCLVNGTR